MTGKERFLKVFAHELPDRVPVTTFIWDQGFFLSQQYDDYDSLEMEKNLLRVVEIQRQLGMDLMPRPIIDNEKYRHINWGGVNVFDQTENWEVTTEVKQEYNSKIEISTIKTPLGTLTQEFTTFELRKNTNMFACTKKPVEKPEDLDIVIKYEPRLDENWKPYVKRVIDNTKKAVGEDGVVCPCAGNGPFNMSAALVPSSEIYCMFLAEPEFYKKIMEFSLERIKDYVDAVIEANPETTYVGGNVPGGFLGKKFYDEYVLPYEKRYIDYVQRTGIPTMYHNCGEVMNLVESYIDLGCRIVEPFSPPPLGDADLAKAKELSRGEYVILGGVDQVDILQKGTVDLVKQVTKDTVLTGKPGGKFLLQSADLLELDTPIENIEAYVKTGIEYGGY